MSKLRAARSVIQELDPEDRASLIAEIVQEAEDTSKKDCLVLLRDAKVVAENLPPQGAIPQKIQAIITVLEN